MIDWVQMASELNDGILGSKFIQPETQWRQRTHTVGLLTRVSNKHPGKLTDGVILPHNSDHAHIACRVQDQLDVM
jgi:hypothetical protein